MFTGIIEGIGVIESIEKKVEAGTLVVSTPFDNLALGESVAINGTCLTVAGFIEVPGQPAHIVLDVSPETLSKTNLGGLVEQDQVNLERALPLGGRLSGHIVQGHVDGVARLSSISSQIDSWLIEVELPKHLLKYVIEKGSIALDGISLTINKIGKNTGGIDSQEPLTKMSQKNDQIICLTIIPHTWAHTTLRTLKIGHPINVEVDLIAKYTERLCTPYLKS